MDWNVVFWLKVESMDIYLKTCFPVDGLRRDKEVWLCWGRQDPGLYLFVCLFFNPFIQSRLHPPSGLHTLCSSSHISTPSLSPTYFLGPQVLWGIGAPSFTEDIPVSPLLYVSWGNHISWCMLPGNPVSERAQGSKSLKTADLPMRLPSSSTSFRFHEFLPHVFSD